MDFRALADNTLRCLMNYYRDGGDCKGIVHFLLQVVDQAACKR